MKEPLPFALGQLDRLMNFFPRVDAKAAALFGLDAAMMGIVALNFPYKNPEPVIVCLGGGALALLLVSIWQAYQVLVPHTGSPDGKSPLYFGDIAVCSASEYLARLRSMTECELFEDAASQIHRNAEILRDKYRHVERGAMFTAFAFVFWIVFLGAVALAGPVKVAG